MTKYDLSKGKDIPTLEEAETYDWWTDYLAARTKGIKCCMVLGKSEEEITRQFGLNPIQGMGLMDNVKNGRI